MANAVKVGSGLVATGRGLSSFRRNGYGPARASVRPPCGLRFPAATVSPRYRITLLRRSMQCPLWIIEMGSAQCAEIRPAGQDDRVHVVVRRDRTDGDDLHTVFAADLVAYPLGRGRLVTAPIGRPFVGDNLTGGHVDAGRAVLCERPRDLHRGAGVEAAAA